MKTLGVTGCNAAEEPLVNVINASVRGAVGFAKTSCVSNLFGPPPGRCLFIFAHVCICMSSACKKL